MQNERAVDVNKSYKTMKFLALAAILGMVVTSIASAGILYLVYQHNTHKAYFITENGTYVGIEKEDRKITYFNVKNHVRKFMGLMYAHNAQNYESRVNAALELIDKNDGKLILKDFTKGKVLENYKKYGSSTIIKIDSIRPNLTQVPYSVNCYAKQYTRYDDKEIPIEIGIYFELEPTDQTDINTDGIMLKNFHYFPYHPVANEDNGEIDNVNEVKEEAEPVAE